MPLVPGFGVYLIVPSGLTTVVPFVGFVLTTGKVTFVKSAGVPSGFLSFVNTGIVVGVPAVAKLLSGLAHGPDITVTGFDDTLGQPLTLQIAV